MPSPRKLLHYRDLVDYGVVQNRTTLARLIERHGFPPGFKLAEGGNSRCWATADVDDWVAQRSSSATEDNST